MVHVYGSKLCCCIDHPPAITTADIIEVCTNDFTVSWTTANNEEGLSYDVMLFSPSMMNGIVVNVMMDTSYNFTDLIPDTDYNVSVASRLTSMCLGIAHTIPVTTLMVEAGLPQGKLIVVIYTLEISHLFERMFVSWRYIHTYLLAFL